MVDAHVVIPEEGEPRIAGRRIAVLSVVMQVGGSTKSVEEYAEDYNLDEEDVRAALSWASNHEEKMVKAIRRRAESMREMSDCEYPDFVEDPGNADVDDYEERARRALSTIAKDCHQYADKRWGKD